MTYTDRYGEITIDDILRLSYEKNISSDLKNQILAELQKMKGWIIHCIIFFIRGKHTCFKSIIFITNNGMYQLCITSYVNSLREYISMESNLLWDSLLSDSKIDLIKNNKVIVPCDKGLEFPPELFMENYRNLLFQDDMMDEIKALQGKNTEMMQENEDLKRRLSRLEKFIDGLI